MRRRGLGVAIVISLAAFGAVDPGNSRFAMLMENSMKTMDRKMMTAQADGDTDHDFAVMMLPHHEGAIDMAKAELLYGHDPAMRRLAQEILVDQGSEIQAMNHWLQKYQMPADRHTSR